eukprot:TRINITY_DN1904_c0_g1_i3.p1 TRINITY_DN1904_c0_g1~~TRINITY_DN1904_c0_g1_i3.p1  ORF type:complete len:228 (-),score=20.36 TRINITY_DN1904_c0_g1_i3:327-953(-)
MSPAEECSGVSAGHSGSCGLHALSHALVVLAVVLLALGGSAGAADATNAEGTATTISWDRWEEAFGSTALHAEWRTTAQPAMTDGGVLLQGHTDGGFSRNETYLFVSEQMNGAPDAELYYNVWVAPEQGLCFELPLDPHGEVRGITMSAQVQLESPQKTQVNYWPAFTFPGALGCNCSYHNIGQLVDQRSGYMTVTNNTPGRAFFPKP